MAANNTTVLRRATLLVAGRTLTVDQAGAGGTCTPQPLSTGQTVTGMLSNADCRSRLQLGSDNAAATVKQYSLNLQAGQQMFVNTMAVDFSPVLVLYNASGREVARGGSRLPNTGFFEAPATSSYLLEVTTSFATFGNYLFSLSYSDVVPLSLAPSLRLTSEKDVLLAESRRGGLGLARLPQETGFFTPPTSGTYFLEAVADSLQPGTYTLRLERPSGCAFSFVPATPGGLRFEADGGPGSFKFVSGNGCNWTLTSANANWLMPGSASLTNSGTANFTVAANTTQIAWRATLSAGGQTYNLEQAGMNGRCLPQPLAANQTINGTLTPGDCASALPPPQFGPTGAIADRYVFTGNAGDQVAVLANLMSSQFFSAQLTIVDPRGVILSQTTLSASPPPISNPFFTLPLGGEYQIEVSTSGANIGQINSYALSLVTAPKGCGYMLSASGQGFESQGGMGNVTVTASSGCAWRASASANWVTLAATGGMNNVVLSFTVAANETSSSRSATLLIGDRIFQIEQSGNGGSCASTPLTPGQLVNGTLSPAACPIGSLPNRRRGNRYIFAGKAGEQFALQAFVQSGVSLNVLGPGGGAVIQLDSQSSAPLRIPTSEPIHSGGRF